MGKVLPILGIIASLLAALAATVLQNMALLVVTLFAVTSAIMMFITKDRNAIIAGVIVLILGVVGGLGQLGSITTEDGATDFGISQSAGTAMLVLACLAITGSVLVFRWGDYQPNWMGYALAAVLVLAAIDTLSIQDKLGDQSSGAPFGVVVLSLMTLPVGILALRQE